jgi:hypothetical protein
VRSSAVRHQLALGAEPVVLRRAVGASAQSIEIKLVGATPDLVQRGELAGRLEAAGRARPARLRQGSSRRETMAGSAIKSSRPAAGAIVSWDDSRSSQRLSWSSNGSRSAYVTPQNRHSKKSQDFGIALSRRFNNGAEAGERRHGVVS